ncbi:serine hydrolase [Rhizobium sp. L1K21]|uniref:serine hydrolase domain-containing protein n=1 Tax=Rhizobium sp. L1K21 TaxID=2954933 RepID=UPI002092F62A|nr:serine hydrolase domain-containing protein [Rhizobium sp. L1K21]MCO6184928.1 beta-lactamase family protein [Rhizobium sp. L1K21]
MKERIDAAIDKAMGEKRITGTAIIVKKDGETVFERFDGFADRESGKPVEPDTIFRLASVTKPLVAATALAMIDKGKLSLDTLVREPLPYFTPKERDGTLPDITVRHLLTHTAGFSYGINAYGKPASGQEVDEGLVNSDLSFEENFRRMAAIPLLYKPGKLWRYSTAIDVLGAVIAAVEGTSLDEALRKYVTGPLGMSDTGFVLSDKDRLATPYADAKPEPVVMQDPHTVPDREGNPLTFSPNRIFNPKAYQSGGAGAVGTAPDIIAFLEAIRQGGAPILSKDITAQAMANQIGTTPRPDTEAGIRFGFIGAVIEDEAVSRVKLPKGTVNWGGVYGHSWFIDPVNGISTIIMTNNAVEGCMGAYPGEIMKAIYG